MTSSVVNITAGTSNDNGTNLNEDCRNRPIRREFNKPIRKLSARPLPSLMECPSDQSRDAEIDSLNESYTDRRMPLGSPSTNGPPPIMYHPKLKSNKKLLSLLSYDRSRILGTNNPFHSFWVLLSSLYGVLLLVIMFTICLIEIMDNPVKLFTLQGMFLVYLYVGSIAVIICIYVWVLKDSCSSLRSISSGDDSDSEDFSHFGSLKRAHISRTQTSSTSFYLRIGALLFGLGTLVLNGLELAMRSTMDVSCLTDIMFIHPILNALFTFLQMHFLFVNSQVLVEKFGLIARFGFVHLTATNVALWLRLVIWETGLEWIYFVYLAQNNANSMNAAATSQANVKNYEPGIPNPLQLHGFPRAISNQYEKTLLNGYNRSELNEPCFKNAYNPISQDHMDQVISLHYCINANSLGQLWSSSMPFLYPFTVQFCLIAAGVTYVMSQHVGVEKLYKQHEPFSGKKLTSAKVANISRKRITSEYDRHDDHGGGGGIDCNGISKGLFLGLLCIVIVIVTAIIFLVVKDDEDFPPETWYWLTSTTSLIILSFCVVVNSVGLCQIRKLSYVGRSLSTLDSLLSTVSVAGVLVYSVFGMVVGLSGLMFFQSESSDGKAHATLLVVSFVQIVQSSIQSTFIIEALQRACTTRSQQISKPGRQVVTFLLCANVALWTFDSFVTQSWLSQELQLRFCGLLLWGVVSRLSLPLLTFYRFHSAILLLEIWHRCYTGTSKRPDSFN